MIKRVSYSHCSLVESCPVRLTRGAYCRYFRQRSLTDLDESELHRLRMQGCERMAKLMIDSITSNDAYLFTDVLLRR